MIHIDLIFVADEHDVCADRTVIKQWGKQANGVLIDNANMNSHINSLIAARS
ncbi:hypothetical protein VCHA37P193_70066 [Vibrio chagasii]|nr:hypothetical protein VCHA36P164_100164 [Vibrio chagasii]CAH7317401.1 hypothetical protein VCHA41O246_50126 [Vibrio chagasii]CAH7362091.1 hypothetical protein VCHA40P242_80048 [Vibrio chagasii]CAH7367044.1 hypothetical protein VCHA37P193_70066 [Vibrio chagasii]